MSKYTTEVRYICEQLSGLSSSVGYNSVDKVLDGAIKHIFDFDFPIFDENYRSVLEKKILKHYYTREICEETYGLWKLRLDTRLNEIMPYYNKLYQSELFDFNPLYDVDLTTKHSRKNDGTTNEEESAKTNETVNREDSTSKTIEQSRSTSDETSAESSANGTVQNTDYDMYSDTPQGALTNVENESYLTNARKKTNNDVSNTTTNNTLNSSTEDELNVEDNTGYESEITRKNNVESNSTTIASNTEEYIESVVGKTGGVSYSARIKEFRDTLLNIDVAIINELSDLFFGLW